MWRHVRTTKQLHSGKPLKIHFQMNTIDVRSGVRRVAQAAPIAGLMAGMLLAAAGFAAAQAQQRGTYLGPHQGETLTSWTQRWLEGPVQYIATPDEKEIYGAL